MNVQSSCWPGQIPNPQQPLSNGLRAVYEAQQQLPSDLSQLLAKLEPEHGRALAG
jgi:hypothetical protein